VVLRQTSGSVVVRGSSSPIEVTQVKSLPAGSRIELITTYKPVVVEIPADADVAISASTQYGQIRSDFPVYLLDKGTKSVEVELGKASITVRIETSGDITIRKKSNKKEDSPLFPF
jgi:hypothetical protein